MRKIISVLLSICLGILVSANTIFAATPRVMVADYTVKEDKVIAGQKFTLTIVLKNTAKKAVKNIKLTIGTENGELLPAGGAGTAYVEQIEAESEKEFTFKMEAVDGLEEKAYKLAIKTEYENTEGLEYTVEDSIFIPISLEQRLSVSDVFLAGSVELGDIVEISAVVNNLGGGTLYNVTAKVTGDNMEEAENYVGNIETGKSGMIDILTKATALTKGGSNQITIFYEDRNGNVYEKEKRLSISVTEPHYENMEKVKVGKSSSDIMKLVLRGVAVVLVIAVIIFLFIRRKKRKQKMFEEFKRRSGRAHV